MRPATNVAFASRLVCRRASLTLAVATVCLAGVGCAQTLSWGFADFQTERAVEKAAADDSFPSAAEVGLDATDTSADSSAETSPDTAADPPADDQP